MYTNLHLNLSPASQAASCNRAVRAIVSFVLSAATALITLQSIIRTAIRIYTDMMSFPVG